MSGTDAQQPEAPLPMGSVQKADRLILLDRDGVINFDSPSFIRSAEEWLPIPGALEAVVLLHQKGFLLGICTNQSGVGRGLLDEQELLRIHSRMDERLRVLGGRLDGWRYCPHRPEENCHCRKPRPGMLLELMREFSVAPSATCFVGDSLRDVEAAQAAGCEPVLVRTGHGHEVEEKARQAGVVRIYDDLAQFATAEIARAQHSGSQAHK